MGPNLEFIIRVLEWNSRFLPKASLPHCPVAAAADNCSAATRAYLNHNCLGPLTAVSRRSSPCTRVELKTFNQILEETPTVETVTADTALQRDADLERLNTNDLLFFIHKMFAPRLIHASNHV